jgi:hypothetical protein
MEIETRTFSIGEEKNVTSEDSQRNVIIFLSFCVVLFSFLASLFCRCSSRKKKIEPPLSDQLHEEEEKEEGQEVEKASLKTFLQQNLKYKEGKSVPAWLIAEKYVEWCQEKWDCKPKKYTSVEMFTILLGMGCYERVDFPGMMSIKNYHF